MYKTAAAARPSVATKMYNEEKMSQPYRRVTFPRNISLNHWRYYTPQSREFAIRMCVHVRMRFSIKPSYNFPDRRTNRVYGIFSGRFSVEYLRRAATTVIRPSLRLILLFIYGPRRVCFVLEIRYNILLLLLLPLAVILLSKKLA